MMQTVNGRTSKLHIYRGKAAVRTPVGRMKLDGFLAWIKHCNTGKVAKKQYTKFKVADVIVGYAQPGFVELLQRFPEIFKVADDTLLLADGLDTPTLRSQAVAGVLQTLNNDGHIHGWRNELYPVADTFGSEPLLLIERAAAVYLGIKSYGVHVNGWTLGPSGKELWVARRNCHKPTWPGKLDHICAGGQPHGISPAENVIKECCEEASIPEDMARTAMATGAVSYEALQEHGLKRDVLFCYDLKLPAEFVPQPADGEVESFTRMPIAEVAHLVNTSQEFKDNCNLVIIDFLIRHGVITPESPGYLHLLSGLRAGDCS